MEKAQHSSLALWWFNRVMGWAIPFNQAHGFRVAAIGADSVTVAADYRRRNFNHIRGIHACAIATIGEYAAGLMLMRQFTPRDYRLIMASLEVEYHYQAKQAITAMAAWSPADTEQCQAELVANGRVMQTMRSHIADRDGHHVATVTTHWQIKSWQQVKTKA